MVTIKDTLGLSIFMIVMLLIPSSSRTATDCSVHTRCDACILSDPTCVWCDDMDVLIALAGNTSTTKPAQLCGSEEEMVNLACKNIVNPQSTVQTSNASQAGSSSSYVSITSATVNLRPGKPVSFNVMVSPPESAAVDMYLLLDLSYTMSPNLRMLQSLAIDLVARMRNLSSDFRIGFGSFIDKTVSPYADTNILDFPCAREYNGFPSPCSVSYAFRHSLSFTSNASAFQEVLNSADISASEDEPESILDALLQCAVCEEELGWRSRGQSQRIVVAFTDGDYHYALDGKIAGIATPPSTQCQINPATKEYNTANMFEYPSVAFISEVLNENLVTPIFVAISSRQAFYDNLAGSIKSAAVGTLSSDGTQVISVIEDEYKTISGTVTPTVLIPDDLKSSLTVSVLPQDNCGSGYLESNFSDICVNVSFPKTVSYAISVQGNTELCQHSGSIQIQIQFIRFGTVTVDIVPQCECQCTDNAVPSSPMCNGIGSLECSTCFCNDLAVGALCQCPVVSSQSDADCIHPLETEGKLCSGHGTCNCGKCICNSISADTSLQYQGSHCQFDPNNCPQGRSSDGQLKPCAGNGKCVNFQCDCDAGFSGRTCDCTTDNSTCINPAQQDGTELCSGVGTCVCGQCICTNYSINFGKYCEDCLPCRTSCSRVSPCVLCNVLDQTACPPDLSCLTRVTVNSTNAMAITEGMKICSLRQESCEVRYFLNTKIQGNESNIKVFLDYNQPSLVTLREGSSNCNRGIELWPIFLGIILGTIVVGMLVFMVWRCCTYFGEYLEYQQWEKSIRNETENTGENPLFVEPVTKYSNPRYTLRK